MFLCSTQITSAQLQLLSLEGTYQDKNLLVNNPPMPDGFGFCISKVLVNGETIPTWFQMISKDCLLLICIITWLRFRPNFYTTLKSTKELPFAV
jgi:hypothetical protein